MNGLDCVVSFNAVCGIGRGENTLTSSRVAATVAVAINKA